MTVESERHERLSMQAKEAFKNHQLSRQSDGRWLLQKRYSDDTGWDWTMAAEVISLAGGELYVGGDIDFCIFGYYSDKRDHESKMRWMGEHTDIGYYVAQKARISSGRELTEHYDEEVALDEVKSWLAELERDDEEAERTSEDTVKLRSRLDRWKEWGFPENEHELMAELWEDLSGDLLCDRGCPGTVLAARVYYAHAALARLCELLDASTETIP